MEQQLKLWYRQPAGCHEEAMPIGNGSLGALVFGGVNREELALNEDSLWSGYPRDKNRPEAAGYLNDARNLIWEGRVVEAEKLIQDHMLGEYTEAYMPLGQMFLEYAYPGEGSVTEYERSLLLNEAVSNVSYRVDGTRYQRAYFASFPDQAIVCMLRCEKPEMRVHVRFDSLLCHQIRTGEEGTLEISGQCPEHVDPNYCPREERVQQGSRGRKFQAACRILDTDGNVEISEQALTVSGATFLVLAFHMGDRPSFPLKSGWEELKARHVQDYTRIFDRVDLYLGPQDPAPTDERLEKVRHADTDPSLYALYFQYGRYLLIASSRKGSQPANLQGIWSWDMTPPWSSNWTTNINLQMNYWHACSCNLLECMDPYFDLLKRICANGRETARTHYGCRGSVLHHNTDYWASTNPTGIFYGGDRGDDGSVTWSFWVMGEAWMCQALYEYYEYTHDEAFLRDTVYPILRENALFLNDWLVERDGVFESLPSTSPENRFLTADGQSCCVSRNCAMDLELIREVFTHFRRTCEILGLDDPLLAETEHKLRHLAPIQIGSRGQILEWGEEYGEVEPGHRHVSLLYGLYPSDLFEGNPEMMEAARKTLQLRIENGGGYTGWSCAWLISLYAVLGDRENAARYLHVLLSRSTYPNMWDAHPPFQIDGNFGGAAGIANMLVQDRGGEVRVLPALPENWKDGYVRGLRIRGGKTIDIEWKNGQAVSTEIHPA